MTPSRDEALNAVRTLLSYIGDDPNREGLVDTPKRVLRAWTEEWGSGYHAPEPEVRLFTDTRHAAMVVQRNITFYSHCCHHMAPFYGRAHVAYLPQRGVLGLSKLARVVNYFARRLQMQESLTDQIADFLGEKVSPDVGVVMHATHLCMNSRGVAQHEALTSTSALRGKFFNYPEVRSEFLSLAR